MKSIGSLFGGPPTQTIINPPPVLPPPVMPSPAAPEVKGASAPAVAAAKKKSIVSQIARRGRQSTILSDAYSGETLG